MFACSSTGDVNGREVRMSINSGTSLSHNIFTSMNLGYGAAIFGRFCTQGHEMGINIALGTDDQCCSNNMDMFRGINATSLVHKEVQYDTNLRNPEDMIKMSSINDVFRGIYWR